MDDEAQQRLPFAGHPHLPAPSFMTANQYALPAAATPPQPAYERFERPYIDPIPSATPGRNGRRDIAPATSGQQRQCDYCGTTRTPMWRRGPRGKHTLCNACGVKWKDGRIQIPLEDETVSTGPNPVFTPPFGQPHPAPARFGAGSGDGRDAAAILHSLGGGNAAPQAPLRPPAAFGYDPSSASMRTQLPPLYGGGSGPAAAVQHQAGSGDLHKFAPMMSSASAAHSAWYAGGVDEHDERTLKKRKYLAGGACAGAAWETIPPAAELAEAPLGSSEREHLKATIAKMQVELNKSRKEREKLASQLTTNAEREWRESAVDSQAATMMTEVNKLRRELSMSRNQRQVAEDMVLRLCGLMTKNNLEKGVDDAVVQQLASALASAPAIEPESSRDFLNTLADALTREERLRNNTKRVAIQSLTALTDDSNAHRASASSFGKSALYYHQHQHQHQAPSVDSMNVS